MKFQRILQIVNCEPWLITSAAHAQIRTLIDSKLKGAWLEMPMDDDDEAEKPPTMERIGSVAVIPVQGVIGKGLSRIEKSCGACDVGDIGRQIDEALMDSGVSAILLQIDSPGGSVAGVAELGDKIKAADEQKPVCAYTDGQCDSAAYWLAAGCRMIYASRGAEVGCIGVYIPWVDQTQAYAKEGYKVDIIKNDGGTYKGMGYPGTALTDEQRAHLQGRVDDIFGMFTAHIRSRRAVSDEAMQGQTFLAVDAKKIGLIDDVATLEACLTDCASLAGR